jgi:PIN domain nuclease of toxin-antitoxin system
VASVWEIDLKHRKGKLNAEPSIVDANIQELGILPLAITVRHVRALATLGAASGSTVHKDPFDRLIAAQAVAENLPLVTADSAFAQYSQIRVVW